MQAARPTRSTASSPRRSPPTSSRPGSRPPAPGNDVNAACAGFLVALDEAAALIESGRAECVLVCGAEALSRIVDHDDRGTAVLFGDGAGAVVVGRGAFDVGCASFTFGSS